MLTAKSSLRLLFWRSSKRVGWFISRGARARRQVDPSPLCGLRALMIAVVNGTPRLKG
jgi:hypothetical protein